MNDKCEIILSVFRELPDPRVERTKVHSLEIIMFIALACYLSGGESFNDMQLFADTRKDWLTENIGMKSVPSHDTFNRVFQAISQKHFGECLQELTSHLRENLSDEIVAFDGKTHRRTGDSQQRPLHTLNAWAVNNRLVLGQLTVEEKSNEITAIPQLMDKLDLKGCIITADALNCQKKIAKKAVEQKADYVLALKGNQRLMYDEVKSYLDVFTEKNAPGYETIEKGHGRFETRRYWQTTDISWCSEKEKWANLSSFAVCESIREINGVTNINRRYFISSLTDCGVKKIASAIRAHWQIENALHWRLDVVFNEDQSRARIKNAAKNLGTLRAICLNLMKKVPGKESLKGKRYKAALSIDYLVNAIRL